MKDRVSPRSVPSYDLRIDELVLDGFPPAERYAIAAAMERELARLLTGPNVPFAAAGGLGSIAVDRLDAVVTLAPGASPQNVGVEAARVIGRNLGVLANGGHAPSGGKKS
jgi:hypothetical protein